LNSFKKKEQTTEEETVIWQCNSNSCNGWIRMNFAFDDEPKCPLCGTETTKGLKMLPVLVNHATS
jgi:rubrerythrin